MYPNKEHISQGKLYALLSILSIGNSYQFCILPSFGFLSITRGQSTNYLLVNLQKEISSLFVRMVAQRGHLDVFHTIKLSWSNRRSGPAIWKWKFFKKDNQPFCLGREAKWLGERHPQQLLMLMPDKSAFTSDINPSVYNPLKPQYN